MTRFWDGQTDGRTDGRTDKVTALLDLLSPSATQVKKKYKSNLLPSSLPGRSVRICGVPCTLPWGSTSRLMQGCHTAIIRSAAPIMQWGL